MKNALIKILNASPNYSAYFGSEHFVIRNRILSIVFWRVYNLISFKFALDKSLANTYNFCELNFCPSAEFIFRIIYFIAIGTTSSWT